MISVNQGDPRRPLGGYMTEVEDWLRLYGIDADKILDAGRRDLADINGRQPIARCGL